MPRSAKRRAQDKAYRAAHAEAIRAYQAHYSRDSAGHRPLPTT
jgi:hypothetical protein